MCSSVGSMKPTEGHRKLFPSISSRLPSMGTHLFQPEAAAVRVRSYIFFSILINGTAATLQEVELKSVIHGSWHRRPIATLSSSGDWTDESSEPKRAHLDLVAAGDARIVQVDTVRDLAYASELGNYAEYSGTQMKKRCCNMQ
ncbi:unnamed protein product [Victoria cruziana]